jgi:capsular polysaccharide biosynthesis protein
MVRIKEDAFLRIKKLESDIQKIGASIKLFEQRKNFANPIEIIQEPIVSYKPVKPKKLLNGAIVGFLGLFAAVFGAFFKEYIRSKRETPGLSSGNK